MSHRPFAWIAGLTVGIATAGIAAIVIFIGTGVSESSGQRGPSVGEHWHALYQVTICGEVHPPAPTWEGTGVHTHQDGIIHSHPFTQGEAGEGARLVKWFEYGGGVLTEDELRVPGFPATYEAGARCPDGSVGFIQVFANGEPIDLESYIPQDGDQVKIVFGPPDNGQFAVPATPSPRPSTSAQITVELQDNAFVPSRIAVPAGEPVLFLLMNTGDFLRNLRIAGPDAQFETGDDIIFPDVDAGGSAEVVVTINEPGEYLVRDDFDPEVTAIIVAQ